MVNLPCCRAAIRKMRFAFGIAIGCNQIMAVLPFCHASRAFKKRTDIRRSENERTTHICRFVPTHVFRPRAVLGDFDRLRRNKPRCLAGHGRPPSDNAPATTSRFNKRPKAKLRSESTLHPLRLCATPSALANDATAAPIINIKNVRFLLTMLIELVDRVYHSILQSAPRSITEWFIRAAFANFFEDNLPVLFDVNFPWHERI